MRLRLLLPLLPLLLGACSPGGIISAAGDCTLVAQVDNVVYAVSANVSGARVGAEYTRTVRHRDCEDVIELGQPAPARWQNGDSSFAPNTPLHVSLDEPSSQVLLVPAGDGTWIELRRLANQ
jgi:hypothetical protein